MPNLNDKENSINLCKSFIATTGKKMIIPAAMRDKFQEWDWWEDFKDLVLVSERIPYVKA